MANLLIWWRQRTPSEQRLLLGLTGLLAAVGPGMHRLAQPATLRPARLALLALVVVFVGWWGQGPSPSP